MDDAQMEASVFEEGDEEGFLLLCHGNRHANEAVARIAAFSPTTLKMPPDKAKSRDQETFEDNVQCLKVENPYGLHPIVTESASATQVAYLSLNSEARAEVVVDVRLDSGETLSEKLSELRRELHQIKEAFRLGTPTSHVRKMAQEQPMLEPRSEDSQPEETQREDRQPEPDPKTHQAEEPKAEETEESQPQTECEEPPQAPLQLQKLLEWMRAQGVTHPAMLPVLTQQLGIGSLAQLLGVDSPALLSRLLELPVPRVASRKLAAKIKLAQEAAR